MCLIRVLCILNSSDLGATFIIAHNVPACSMGKKHITANLKADFNVDNIPL